jgi:hypothetical protein
MKFFKVSLILTLSILFLAAVSYVGFLLISQWESPSESPEKAIAENTVLVIKIQKPAGLVSELQESNLIWKDFTRFPVFHSFRDDIEFMDSAIRKNPKMRRILQNSPLILTLSMTGRTTFGLLYLTSVPGTDPGSSIKDFIKDLYRDRVTIVTGKYASVPLEEVIVKGTNEPLYFAVKKGVFMASRYPDLVKKAIDRLSINISSLTGTGFSKVESFTGKKVDGNIYINYRYLSAYLSKYIREEYSSDLVKMSLLGDWSGLDLIIKRNELLVNGYTTYNDTVTQFLPLFREQYPQKDEITRVIPDNVISFLSFGLSDPALFYSRLRNYTPEQMELRDEYPSLVTLEDRDQAGLSRYFTPWMGNEMAVIHLEPKEGEGSGNIFVIFKVNNKILADSLMKQLPGSPGKKTERQVYRDAIIGNANIPYLVPGAAGTFLGKLKGSWYAFFDNYLIFANDPSDLKKLIDRIKSGKVLANSEKYRDFRENVSDESSIYFYFNASRSVADIKSVLADNLEIPLDPVIDTLRKFESMAVKLSNRNGIFYTSVIMRYNPAATSEGPLQWQSALDTLVMGAPKIVTPKQDGEPAVMAFDQANNLYMLDNFGNIRWKLHFSGKLVGGINEFYPRNADSALYLFNTESDICLINAQGSYIHGFPVRLTTKATNPLTLITVPGSRESHILVALADKKLHSFSLAGESEAGWNNQFFPDEITNPVQSLTVNHKDYLFITGKNGDFRITDPKGNMKIKLPKNIRVAEHPRFCLNRTGKRGLFLTSDNTGKVLFIQENGSVTETTFNLFSPDHRFFYEDINDDGTPEFIFYNKNSLYYYNRFYKLKYSYSFRREIADPPFMVESPDGDIYIGFVSSATNEIFLFGKKGLIQTDAGIRGNTPFDIGRLTSQRYEEIIIGAGKYVRAYRLSQD